MQDDERERLQGVKGYTVQAFEQNMRTAIHKGSRTMDSTEKRYDVMIAPGTNNQMAEVRCNRAPIVFPKGSDSL